ncbi:isoleucine--tRNA ligase [bacterium]|nr:isoleucine--tRNA ligase [bacterium]
MFDPVQSGVTFPALEEKVLEFWRTQDTFAKSVERNQGNPTYVFYEGPPTANGKPGVHHVQARAYKDLFPRYKTMRGYQVPRKAGWDCHGLPVEIEVEKKLGFSGKKAIEEYGVGPFNKECRQSVMEYEGLWEKMTERIGYWTDLEHAYMTMSNDFVESVWWSLKELWKKDLLYLGYKVVPYCAKDGTPLSSHEVGLGYKDVRDPSIFVRFPLRTPEVLGLPAGSSLLVWTTTPWTLPGNVAAAVKADLNYVAVRHEEEVLVLAETLIAKVFDNKEVEILSRFPGSTLENQRYVAPYDFFLVADSAHHIVTADFVTAEDGTGIVHIAPAFGADDLNVGRQHNLPVLHSVDTSGRFVPEVAFLAGQWFKDADPLVIRELKERKLLFKRQDYNHSYPHCWRCSQPLMYFATDSWFIANTKLKDRLIEKNQEIDWHPAHIKSGRYGDWLNNLVDWALSRTRYWGTPLPIWICQGCGHKDCVGGFEELAQRSIQPLDVKAKDFDPHRPFIDEVELKCEKCQGVMRRVPDVIDCWYDSGAMPFAQLHYPFENKELFQKSFPGDFICEGLDQTRGWFNSLHQLGVMLFDSIAYKSVICHGLVLDGNGEKMSKSRGNVVNPWEVIAEQGADALRWYLFASAPPEVSRRFSSDLVGEASRRYLGTLWNTYYFFVLNANSNQVDWQSQASPTEMDRWIGSALNQVVAAVTGALDDYDPTGAARALQEFVDELSNWYVRRNRRRFWQGDSAAFQTLFQCLLTVVQLTAPFTPFVAEEIYQNLRKLRPELPASVHLCDWPEAGQQDEKLLYAMNVALRAVSAGRSARTASGLRTRQPLAYALVGGRTEQDRQALQHFSAEIQDELNVKEIRLLGQSESFLDYQIRPNLPLLGKKLGKQLPALKNALASANPKELAEQAHREGQVTLELADGSKLQLTAEELLIEARSPAGYSAQEDQGLVVALSTELTPELIDEGIARDTVRHLQELRKNQQLDVTDRIQVYLWGLSPGVDKAVQAHKDHIAKEVLAVSLELASPPADLAGQQVNLGKDGEGFQMALRKAQ